MATINVSNKTKNNQKKAVCSMVAKITPAAYTIEDDGVAASGTLASGDVLTLGNLPADAVVVDAFVVVKTGATGGTQTLKITVGGTDVISAVAVGTAANAIKGGTVTRKASGTGAAVTATVGTADLTDGEFYAVIEYIEYTRTIGQYTN